MFWIVGGDALAASLKGTSDSPGVAFLVRQLEHAKWEGCTFYDVVFPLFVFLVGVSIVFSLGRLLEREGGAAVYKRMLRRFVLLFLLGVFYYGGIEDGFSQMRLLGVLQRLAICYLAAGILFAHLRPRNLVIVCVALLVGYWALLSFVPVPGLGHPSFTRDTNWARYIDQQFLPLRAHYGDWDPEGLLSTFPAISSCLLGVFAGTVLTTESVSPGRKAACFLVGGAALVALEVGQGDVAQALERQHPGDRLAHQREEAPQPRVVQQGLLVNDQELVEGEPSGDDGRGYGGADAVDPVVDLVDACLHGGVAACFLAGLPRSWREGAPQPVSVRLGARPRSGPRGIPGSWIEVGAGEDYVDLTQALGRRPRRWIP